MRETREDKKNRLSAEGTRAVTARWDRYHAERAASGIVEIYDQPHAYGDYEITIKSIRSGRTNVLYLHEGSTMMNFRIDLNGQPFKPELASVTTLMKIIRKNIVKTKSGRIL